MSNLPDDFNSDEARISRYFCYKCNSYVTINPETHSCSRCNEGFIEKIEDDETSDYEEIANSEADIDEDSRTFNLNSRWLRRNHGGTAYLYRPFSSQVRGSPNRGSHSDDDYSASFNELLEAIRVPAPTEGSQGPRNVIGLIRNLNDVFDSRGEFVEDMLNQLLGSFGGDISFPLDERRIDSLPLIPFTEAMIDRAPECPICLVTFAVPEPVVQLSCDHFFHKPCIANWLRMHNTCPVCRAHF